jgi:hypothetical protein
MMSKRNLYSDAAERRERLSREGELGFENDYGIELNFHVVLWENWTPRYPIERTVFLNMMFLWLHVNCPGAQYLDYGYAPFS